MDKITSNIKEHQFGIIPVIFMLVSFCLVVFPGISYAQQAAQSEIQNQQIPVFMNKLKEIFDRNKISKEEQMKVEAAAGDPENLKISSVDIKRLTDKYILIKDEISRLKAPDAETIEIQNLAVGVFDKMSRVLILTSDILNRQNNESSKLFEEIHSLNRQIIIEASIFNDKVKLIRKKYNLGPP
jgi:hypothetical protein